MGRRKLIESYNIGETNVDFSTWPTVNPNSLTDEKRDTYLRRKAAVDMYLTNEVIGKEITERTGISMKEVRRFIKRCLATDENGVVG